MNVQILALIGALVGALSGGIVAWTVCNHRAKVRQARWVAAARHQLAAGNNANRVKITRLSAELDKERESVLERINAAGAEQRSTIARLEGQLAFAYAEIDRMNAEIDEHAGRVPHDSMIDGNGFAMTRPYAA